MQRHLAETACRFRRAAEAVPGRILRKSPARMGFVVDPRRPVVAEVALGEYDVTAGVWIELPAGRFEPHLAKVLRGIQIERPATQVINRELQRLGVAALEQALQRL